MAGLDTNTSLLLHFDGSDGSTTFTDSSLSPKTFSVVGDAQIDTAQSKFGGASGLFDGTGDYIETPDHADWILGGGTGPFTIDGWIRFNSVASCGFLNQGETANDRWNIGFTGTELSFIQKTSGLTTHNMTKSWSPSSNTWYHIAFIRGWGGVNDDFAFTVDGSQVGTTSNVSDNIANFASHLIVGTKWDGGVFVPFNGWMDEWRISNVARWTANFTPPTEAYSVDSNKRLTLLGVG